MDPELLELIRAGAQASRQGAPMSRIDEETAKRSGGRFETYEELVSAAVDSGVPREQLAPPPEGEQGQPADPGLIGEASNVLESFGHSAGFGLTDEVGGLLRGAVTGLVPGGKGFREGFDEGVQRARGSLEEAQAETPIGTTVGGIAGAVAGPGAAGARFATRGGGLVAQSLRGAGAGAAEGAAFEAGTAEGGVESRSEAALRGAKFGGLLGAAAPGAVAGARAAGRGLKTLGRSAKRGASEIKKGTKALGELEEVEELERTIGPRLGDDLRQSAGVEGKPSRVRAEIAEARRGLYGELDEIEEIDSPRLRQALQADEASAFVPEEVAKGQRPPSFVEAQGSLRQIRKAKGAAMGSGDAASVKSLSEAEREIGSALTESVEGLEEANQQYASHMARARALEAGETNAAKSADELQEAFEALDSDVERQAFREGAAHWWLKRLDDHTAIPSTLKKIRTAPESRAKLQLLFDDEQALEEFTDAARNAERIRDRAKAGRLVERELMRQLGRALPWIGGGALGGAAASAL